MAEDSLAGPAFWDIKAEAKSKGKQPIRRAPTPLTAPSDDEDSIVEVAPPPGPPDGRKVLEALHADLNDTLVSLRCCSFASCD